jgi:tetratricopeptide (TPR) repeat protein
MSRGFSPEPAYIFKHAVIQDVAYNSLLLQRRKALHRAVGEAIEALYQDRLEEHYAELAHHFVQGEAWDKALAYCRQAGDKAIAQSAHREAVGAFEQALRVLPHVPEPRERLAQAVDLRLALRTALRPLGDNARILALDDPRRLGQVAVFLAVQFRMRGAFDQAIAAAQRALALATVSGEAVLHALGNQYLGIAYYDQGHYHQAIDCLGQTVTVLKGERQRERLGLDTLPAVLSRAVLAACHAERGAFAPGIAFGTEGLRIAEAVGHPGSLMYAAWGVGLLSLRQGDLPRALPLLEQAVSSCQEADFPGYFPRIAAALGTAYTLCGRIPEAVLLLTQAVEQTMAQEWTGLQALCCLSLGEAQMLAGRLEEAHALTERTLALARQHQERGHQSYALRLLGDIAARREPPERDQAETYYRQALTLAEELGMRPLMAHCHLGIGKLYATVGRRAEAHAELSVAVELYRIMEMTFWLPQAEAVLAEMEG